MNEELANALAALVRQQQLTNLSFNYVQGGQPRVGGEMTMPAPGGELALRGHYQPAPQAQPDWAAMLNYRRPF